MITQLTITRRVPLVGVDPLVLPILDSENAQFRVTDIQGLGPVTAELNSTPFGVRAGEAPGSKIIGKRNIVISLQPNPDWAVESITTLRQELYKYFLPASDVILEFESEELPDVHITGTVESMEPNQFSEDPEIQISVLCFDPPFVSEVEGSVSGEFTEAATPTEITNAGTEYVGFVMTIETPGAGSYGDDLTLYVNDESNKLVIFDVDLNKDNKYILNTISGQRSITAYDELTDLTTSVLNHIDPPINWLQLAPGVNQFYARTDDGTPVDFTLEFQNLYGGL